MNGKGIVIAVSVLAIAGLVALGAFLFGGLDDAGSHDGLGGIETGQSAGPDPDAGTSSTATAVETTSFDPTQNGEVQASVSETETGFELWGMVEDPAGSPLGQATVDLVRDVSVLNTRAQEDEHALGSMETPSSGLFRFKNLDPGERYVLRVRHRDYATARKHPIHTADPRTTNNVLIRMAGGLEISGVVKDKSGQPLEGARVFVYDLNVQAVDPEGQVESTAKTDSEGNYAARHLVAGTKKVVARCEGYSANGRPAVNLRKDTDGKGIDIVLTTGFSISGVILDRDSGQPVEGALVTARPVRYMVRREPSGAVKQQPRFPPRGQVDGAGGRQRRFVPPRGNIAQKAFLLENTRSDKDGRFALGNLMEATYMLMVRGKGYQPNTTVRRDAGSENVEIKLAPSASVSGRVVDGETGRAVAGFSIAVTANPHLSQIPPRLRQRFKDADGNFKYTDVSPGNMYVFAIAEGYAGGRYGPVNVATGQLVEDVVVRLERGATLKGRIVDTKGNPVGGATVALRTGFGGDNPQAQMFLSFLQRQMRQSSKKAISRPDGTWTLPHVMEGSYTIRVSHPDFSNAEKAEVSCGSSGVVEVADLPLTPGATIKGVVRTKSGEPDARASVMITGSDPGQMFNWTGTTNVRGEFECSSLKPGTYRVVVHQREGQLQIFQIFQQSKNPQHEVTVVEGQVLTLQL